MTATDIKYAKIVRTDFSILSRSYDLINNFMSIGTDRQFRYVSIKNLITERPNQSKLNSILDIGTGTGHLANELNKQKPSCFVTGMDISLQMLE
ncbi:MAG: class I SAM-dependent methyltransferase, partial [Candidatus Kariarchaeaceae archaeon]